MPSVEISRDRVLNDREIILFWRACEILDYPYGYLYKLLLLTGQRRTEAATLEWSEIDEDSRTWTVPAHKAKNGNAHRVALSAEAWAIIDGIRHGPRAHDLPKFVFSRGHGKAVAGFSDSKTALDRHMAELNNGAPVEPWRLHDLRRTCATVLTSTVKAPADLVDRILNHQPKGLTGVAAVYNRYGYEAERREALEKLGQFLTALVQPDAEKIPVNTDADPSSVFP